MGRYFKVIDKTRTDGRIDIITTDASDFSHALYDTIREIVGNKVNPANSVLYSIEVDSWGELACEGEIYETKDFVVECISEEEYDDYQF